MTNKSPMNPLLKAALMLVVIVIGGCSFGRLFVPKGDWEKVTSDHFIYYYLPENGVPAVEEIQALESFYQIAGVEWEFPSDKQISYYKFRDTKQRQELTGRSGNGEAFARELIVHTIWPAEPGQTPDFHEVSHIYTIHYATQGTSTGTFSPLWIEGIAMYYSWPSLEERIGYWHGKTVHERAAEMLAADTLPGIEDISYGRAQFDSLGEGTTYPTAGSFVTYLIDGFGMDRFKTFLKKAMSASDQNQLLSEFQEVYGLQLETVETQWREWLTTVPLSSE